MTDISYSWARDIYRIIIHSHFPAIIVEITIIPPRAPTSGFYFIGGQSLSRWSQGQVVRILDKLMLKRPP